MVKKRLIYLTLGHWRDLIFCSFVNICLFFSMGTGWVWSTMAKATAAGTKRRWEAWWLLWCRRPSIDTTGPCAADRSWRDTSSEFIFAVNGKKNPILWDSRETGVELWQESGPCSFNQNSIMPSQNGSSSLLLRCTRINFWQGKFR